MGGPADPAFTVGADAIGAAVGAGYPAGTSPVAWAPDHVIVASSGDLGVTVGLIRPHQPLAGQPTTIPFITVWLRATSEAPWRYIAE